MCKTVMKMWTISVILVGMFCTLAGCASSAGLTDLLPASFEDQIEPLEEETGVALRFVPTADADRIEVNLGSMNVRMNNLFSRMLAEMAEKKFSRIDESSENRLQVAITYLNLDERTYMNAPRLHRVEMAMTVTANKGEREATREITHAAEADLEGYSVRSDQIYDLLLQFLVSIDAFVEAQFSAP